jgi:fructokinase
MTMKNMNRSGNDDDLLVAAVEGGGTSFRVAIATLSSGEIVQETQVPSDRDPKVTLANCGAFLVQHKPPSGYAALGLATFGPVGLDLLSSSTYGTILNSSPKQTWRNVNVLQPLLDATAAPYFKVETDVNAPAWAEYLEARQNDPRISSLAYITVGTGVGVGLVVNHQPVHGHMHPEGGHVSVQPLPGDTFEGYSWGQSCPFVGKRTVEGLASSVALLERWQLRQGETSATPSRHSLADLSDNDEIWQHAANALANLCVTLFLVLSVERIVLGGGLLQRTCLLPLVQQRTVELLNGYLDSPNLDDVTQIITTSRYLQQAGLHGAIVLAQTAYTEGQKDAISPTSLIRVDAPSSVSWWQSSRNFYTVMATSLITLGFFMGRLRRGAHS